MTSLPPEPTRENSTQCELCGNVSTIPAETCAQCGHPLYVRKTDSITNTLALLLTAVILYIPANLFPVMSTYQFGEPLHSTILEGVWTFLHHGEFFIAAIIFSASVVIPLAKILSLSYLCYCVHFHQLDQPREKTRLFQITEALGKWSMIDVFVVVILVSLVRVDNIIFIQSGPGILAFAGVVISTMLAAHQFDPRLLWDRENPKPSSTP